MSSALHRSDRNLALHATWPRVARYSARNARTLVIGIFRHEHTPEHVHAAPDPKSKEATSSSPGSCRSSPGDGAFPVPTSSSCHEG